MLLAKLLEFICAATFVELIYYKIIKLDSCITFCVNKLLLMTTCCATFLMEITLPDCGVLVLRVNILFVILIAVVATDDDDALFIDDWLCAIEITEAGEVN